MDYPIKEIIKHKADLKGKTLVEVAGEIDKTDRWIHGIKSFKQLTVDMVERLSKSINFDLLADYDSWQQNHGEPGLHFKEPEYNYAKSKKITISFSVTGELDKVGKNLVDIVEKVRDEGEKFGLKIDYKT